MSPSNRTGYRPLSRLEVSGSNDIDKEQFPWRNSGRKDFVSGLCGDERFKSLHRMTLFGVSSFRLFR